MELEIDVGAVVDRPPLALLPPDERQLPPGQVSGAVREEVWPIEADLHGATAARFLRGIGK